MADTLSLFDRLWNLVAVLDDAAHGHATSAECDEAHDIIRGLRDVVEQEIQQEVYAAREETAAAALAKLGEKDAQIAALRQQLQETCESFDAVVRAAGPFMPPVPEAPQEHLSGVNDDYYMPGKKDVG